MQQAGSISCLLRQYEYKFILTHDDDDDNLRILLQNKYTKILVPTGALVETVLVVLAAGDVALAALAQDLR